MPKTGGELVVETLKAAGVDTVFGIVSVHNIPIYDAMHRLGGIRPIMVRHEQASVLMADGYSRATGKLGVAITSTGPGAANAMGGMAEAYWANSPVLHIAGNIDAALIGQHKGGLHEAKDQLAMLATQAKWVGRANATADIPSVLTEAIMHALSGRQRPVAVEVPIDQQYYTADVPIPAISLPAPPVHDAAAGEQAAELLAGARRPLFWLGGGAHRSGAGVEALGLARSLGAGILTTITGRGVVPEDEPLCIGHLTPEPLVQQLLADCDVLLAVGTRFQAYNTMNWKMQLPPTILHVNIEADEFDKNYPATVALHGDAKAVLTDLTALLDGRSGTEPGWAERVQQTKRDAIVQQRDNIGPHTEILDAVQRALGRDAIVVKDATIPAYTWGNRLLPVYEPRTAMVSTSVAIGPSLAIALGAAVGQPDRQVVLIAGDGGFLLNIAELSTAAQYGLKLAALVFNDQGYGVLRNHQLNTFEGRHIAVDMAPIDFAGVATAMGAPGRKVTTKDDFAGALDWALAQAGPAVLDISMDGIGPMPVRYGGVSRPPEPR